MVFSQVATWTARCSQVATRTQGGHGQLATWLEQVLLASATSVKLHAQLLRLLVGCLTATAEYRREYAPQAHPLWSQSHHSASRAPHRRAGALHHARDGQRAGPVAFSLLTRNAPARLFTRCSMAVDLGEDPPYIYTAITCMPISSRIPRYVSRYSRSAYYGIYSYRSFRSKYTLSSHCGPLFSRRVDRSIPTVDIEFGSARYSAWCALKICRILAVFSVIYSCTGTVLACRILLACTGRILPYSLACRILLASTAWGAHLQLYRYRTSRMRAPA